MLLRYAVCAIALFASQPLLAQTAPTPASRFYVGLQAGFHRYLIDYPGRYNEITVLPAHLVAGYQAMPRLALQLGASYRHEQHTYGSTASPLPGEPGRRMEEDHWTTDVPLSVRYSLTRQPEKRLQFDLTGGITLVYSRWLSQTTTGKDGVIIGSERIDSKVMDPYLTVGAGLRYGFSPRLALTFDAQVNKLTLTVRTAPALALLRYPSVGLGLRYRLR
ncbi:outer membrane beta-barrel protein [Hymenobacter persicinus]|uniref:Outer membrane protein beta-barrel domain-containing protein n=1 Tax=Hymenobacter persicinus TaxID=2025506 RepID=A0A4Q5LAT5_9BACT|nr:outer membrane beta-barrel protein [Hymenobacter persicinus]RYU79124.1 hypothetical protein EWM57_11350 [Hymenobacter persicinus]